MAVSHQVFTATFRALMRYNRLYHEKVLQADLAVCSGLPFHALSVKTSPLPGAFVAVYAAKRQRARVWTLNHTYAVLLMASMLLSPYTSNQSATAALALAPSGPAFILQYMVYFGGAITGANLPYDATPMLFLMVSGLWFYESRQDVR